MTLVPSSNILRLIATIFVIMIAVAALVMFVVLPMIREIDSIRAEIGLATSEAQLLDGQLLRYQTVIGEINELRVGAEEVVSIFPEREDMLTLVEGLESAMLLAGTSGQLKIADSLEEAARMPAGQSAAGEDLSIIHGLLDVEEVRYTLSFDSDYRGLASFLANVERLPFITVFTSIQAVAQTTQSLAGQRLINTGLGEARLEGLFFISKDLQ